MLIHTEKWDNKAVAWLEDDLQASVTIFAHRLEKQLLSGIFSFAGDMNAGKRSMREGVLRKATGMRSGEPDYRVYLANARIWFIEFKRGKGKVSTEQKERHETLRNLDHDLSIYFCASPAHAIEQFATGLIRRLKCDNGVNGSITRMAQEIIANNGKLLGGAK